MMRELSYSEAICEGFVQLLESDPRTVVLGQGLWSPWYVGSSMTDLDKRFGKDRILDTPVSENAVTGMAVGAAIMGQRPIVVHPRMDFMVLAMDPLVNQASNWSYMFMGRVPVPVVVRSIINRGGEQGAQHSQALQACLAHVPGLKVVMPATPADAKGLLAAAVECQDPVIYIDDRWLYERTGPVEEGLVPGRLGEARVAREGDGISLIAWSYMVPEALAAAEELATRGVSCEVIDLRTIKPWDRDTVFASVRKTGMAVVAEAAWTGFSCAAGIAADVAGACHHDLAGPVIRVGIPDCPTPCASSLEAQYYPDRRTILAAVERARGGDPSGKGDCAGVPGAIVV